MWLPIWPNKRAEMNGLALANRAADWRRLKALVLDSVSSPITKRVFNLGLDEFFAWYGEEPRPGFTKATVSAWLSGPGGPWPRVGIHQRPNHRRSETGGRGCGQRAAGTGTGRRYHPREGRQVQGHPCRELVVRPTGAGTPEYAGRVHQEGAARPGYAGDPARLRVAPVGSGCADAEAHPATRQPVVHCRSSRKARAGAHNPDADVGEGRHRHVDRARWDSRAEGVSR